MCLASVSAAPEASDLAILSDPARSTREMRPEEISLPAAAAPLAAVSVFISPCSLRLREAFSLSSTSIMSTICERLLSELLFVLPTALLACPRDATDSTSARDDTTTWAAPLIVTVPLAASRISILELWSAAELEAGGGAVRMLARRPATEGSASRSCAVHVAMSHSAVIMR